MSEQLRMARHKQRCAARGSKGTTRWTSGLCRVCGTTFVSRHRNVTCGDDCYLAYHGADYARQKAIDRRARRARLRDAFVEKVDPQQVFAADGYRCHICNGMTSIGEQVPHPRAPTVDHVIPLAVGGKHEYANCRTACFLCNSLKRDVVADQLPLLAAG
jgi:5-methylcytosine-specific restriction endonuclease McrA